jgi:cystathionine beta-lyase
MDYSNILNHLGEEREKYFNAISPPIIQTSNFVYKDIKDLGDALENELDFHLYSRGNNPTVQILRKKIAALEKAEDALIFGSGISAISAAIMSHVSAGSHVVCVKSAYGWTNKLLNNYLPRFGVTCTWVDGTNIQEIEDAIQENTTVLYLESPTTMLFELQDLAECAKIARRHNVISICDNSFSTPLHQNPIEFGIDIVVHSGSKYLNGHSDVVMGVLASSSQVVRKIFNTEQMNIGSIISPNDAFLAIRGLRTLEVRLEKSSESASKIIQFLSNHSKVESLNYPLYDQHPQHELAKRQMKGAGGLFSLSLKASTIREMENFVHNLQCFMMAVSWGGYESLIFPLCALYQKTSEEQELPWNFVRLYIGLEDPNLLIQDLEQALKGLN